MRGRRTQRACINGSRNACGLPRSLPHRGQQRRCGRNRKGEQGTHAVHPRLVLSLLTLPPYTCPSVGSLSLSPSPLFFPLSSLSPPRAHPLCSRRHSLPPHPTPGHHARPPPGGGGSVGGGRGRRTGSVGGGAFSRGTRNVPPPFPSPRLERRAIPRLAHYVRATPLLPHGRRAVNGAALPPGGVRGTGGHPDGLVHWPPWGAAHVSRAHQGELRRRRPDGRGDHRVYVRGVSRLPGLSLFLLAGSVLPHLVLALTRPVVPLAATP